MKWRDICALLLLAMELPLDSAVATSPGTQSIVPLGGSGWWIHEAPAATGAADGMFQAAVPAEGWVSAEVPGNLQADLERAHKLRPIFYGATDPELYEVARKDWWYRKDFTVSETYAGKRITLVFDGVDERCEV